MHYPVKSGALINVVAIVSDAEGKPGWNEAGHRDEVLAHYSPRQWSTEIRALLEAPQRWSKWSLYDMPPLRRWGDGPVTLLGDAAHPMLPFLAQGAAMAIEDAAILSRCLEGVNDRAGVGAALARYETTRKARTSKIQLISRQNVWGKGATDTDWVYGYNAWTAPLSAA